MATSIPQNSARFTREQVLAITAGTTFGRDWDAVEGVVTDSRAVTRGNLFVALRGERFDAHAFVEGAAKQGAVALVERTTDLSDDVSAIVVDDTLRALGDLGAAHRASWSGTLIGVTGSAGKTTTKELLGAALRASGQRVLQTKGNLNNRIGVPMTLFQLDTSHATAVIEMGTSQPGEIPRLAEIARPDAGIVTLASLAHTEGLGSVGAVADEKMALLRGLGPEGIAVVYGDNEPLRKRASVLKARRTLLYGRAAENDIRILGWRVERERTLATMQVRGRSVSVSLALLGEGAVLNAAGALTVAYGLDLPIEPIVAGMADVAPAAGRLVPRRGADERLVIDDTYNANPASMAVALSTARAVAEERRAPLVVLLGDMKELGAESAKAHQQVGSLVAEADVFLFVGCGHEMHAAIDEANARGTDTLWFEDSADCAQLADRLPLNAVLLVKGSRSMRMERALAPLLEEAE
ncbi:MAG: UDP-N-acetylmuramoyl-tripeptide--D-alanyl-D-alanine ligase [Myxococcota bacterium]